MKDPKVISCCFISHRQQGQTAAFLQCQGYREPIIAFPPESWTQGTEITKSLKIALSGLPMSHREGKRITVFLPSHGQIEQITVFLPSQREVTDYCVYLYSVRPRLQM